MPDHRRIDSEEAGTGVVRPSRGSRRSQARPLHLYSANSLVFVELRNWIMTESDAEVPVFGLMSGKTTEAVRHLMTKTSQVIRVSEGQNSHL